jgi:hypothetical protein
VPHTNEPPQATANLAVHGEALALPFFEVSHSGLAGEIVIYHTVKPLLEIEQPFANSDCHRLCPSPGAELVHGRLGVLIDRAFGEVEDLAASSPKAAA